MSNFPEAPQEQADERSIPVISRWFGSWQVAINRRAYHVDELRSLYDDAAEAWAAKIAWLGMPSAYQSVWLDALRRFAPDLRMKPLKVLDCGVGDGAFSAALASICCERLDLYGVDLSPAMLKAARHTFADAGVDATLRVACADRLPFEDGAFDIIATAHMLEHLPDPVATLSELRRVLKPGGIIVATMTRRSRLGMLISLKWRTHGVAPAQAEAWLGEAGFEASRCLPQKNHRLADELSVVCIGRKPKAVSMETSSAPMPVILRGANRAA